LPREYEHPHPYTADLNRYAEVKGRPKTLAADFVSELLEVTGGGKARDFEDTRDYAIIRILRSEGIRLREALSLWRGQPLADAAGTEFADVAAIQLAELRDEVAQDRVEAELELGEAASVVAELRSMVSADPLADRPRALLMRALAAAGRQADALGIYTEARELLADQLGFKCSR
jgi:DNA-binding SARP family transcriptional activator